MRFFLLLTFLVGLTACNGPASKTVTYTPSPTAGGRMCSQQCQEAADYCREGCDLKLRQCVMAVQTQAMSDYDKYTREQFFRHESIELRPRDFERQAPCNDSRKQCSEVCDNHYQSCYQDCGGRVNVNSSCQFLCF